MQQELICPNCGARVMEGQRFCGACGANFASDVPPSANTCPGCGSVISPDQRYCGVCGAQLNGISEPPPPQSKPAPLSEPPAPIPQSKPIEEEKAPVVTKEIKLETTVVSRAPAVKYGMLNFAVIIFRIVGWVLLIGGCLGSIAIIVFALLGGGFQPLIPGWDTLTGDLAVGLGIGSFVVSFVYGLAFIAFAELCRVVAGIAGNISGKK
jgi:RNA polymerase subunit RPABC4/transcription elongation factor Spt4